MRWAFDQDQLDFRDAVRTLFAKMCEPALVREAAKGRVPQQVWSSLAELGVLDVLVCEAQGGLGLDERSLVLLLEEAGYVALPHPIVETVAVANPLTRGHTPPGSIITTDLGGPLVPRAADADFILLRRDRGFEIVAARDCAFEPVSTVDPARGAARVRGAGVFIDADLELAFDRGAWGVSAFLIGLGRRMLDDTVAYVKSREQFGAPIGSFQAVKHHLADAALQLEFARPAVLRAAWSLAVDDPNRTRDVSMAKAMASDAASVIGRKALQCHGAIGYTEEYDLQLYLKRSWALARSWGTAEWHKKRVARALNLTEET